MLPAELTYTETHEYLRLQSGEATVGITDHAARELGDIVYVELPAVGTAFKKGQVFGVVESVKAVSDLYMPVGGTVMDTNANLVDDPGILNRDPYGQGWMVRLRVADPAEAAGLLSAAAYSESIEHRTP